MKQAANTLLSEKLALAKQYELVKASLESLGARVSQSDEQVFFVTCKFLVPLALVAI